jgi:hypothetical protein
MRNALAIYKYHLPESEKARFLDLVFPNVAPRERQHYLERVVTPIPTFSDLYGPLASMRPRTRAFAISSILNAADVARHIAPNRRDAFVRDVCGFRSTKPRADETWFEANRPVLRHMSNEDARVMRALKILRLDPYDAPWTLPSRDDFRGTLEAYLREARGWWTDEDRAIMNCYYEKRPREFQEVPEETFIALRHASLGFTRAETSAAIARRTPRASGVLTARTPGVPPMLHAASAVERTRLQNDVRVLHDQRGALQAQLAAKTAVIETLEQERASDRARIAELEAAQNRTLHAFKELQRAEERRLDAYMGVRRAAN